jgi:pyridoxal phosphate enzyme (YggS family)
MQPDIPPDHALDLARNLAEVRRDIDAAARRAGRDPASVTLVAVSKTFPAADVRAAALAGQADFGESYVNEALDKQDEAARLLLGAKAADPRWHFIGHIQTNKARFVTGRFRLIHSVDSVRLAESLHQRAQAKGLTQPVLLQVNLAGEEQKSGVSEAGLPALAEAVASLAALRLDGLMLMPPWSPDPEDARPYFARLREVRDGLEARLGRRLPHLSMGMSGDFVPAVEEGATLVRVGTRIFGGR